jgi:hypothetical protein
MKKAAAPEKEKTRYSDEELEEFREIILQKLEKAQNPIPSAMSMILRIPLRPLRFLKRDTRSFQKKRTASSLPARKSL